LTDVQPQPVEQLWLIDDLWLAQGVGILCGAPKLGKTFLAAQIALAVAGHTEVLGRAARLSGPVLFYGAEDRLHALRTRFDGLALVAGVSVDELPIYLLDTPTLRIDREDDLLRLRAAIEVHQPRLLVLDPFIRMVRIDENSAGDVSAVLASLRAIQRDYGLAVLLVHHARKSPASHPQNALRGSSDFAAWSDSNLYLTRSQHRLCLSVEHRNAPAPEPLSVRLCADPAPHLKLTAPNSPEPETTDVIQTELLCLLSETPRPLSTLDLRQRLRKRKADVVRTLETLRLRGIIDRTAGGWHIKGED